MKTSLGAGSQAYAKPLLLALGMSCYWVWFISGLFSTSVWYGTERTSWTLVLIAHAVTLVALCFLVRRSRPLVERLPVVVGAGLATSAGIVLATLGFNVESFGFMNAPGGLLTGIGSAPLILFWREVSEPVSSKRVERLLVAASVLLAMFLYLFFITLPFVVALTICSAAPLASAFLFRASYFADPCGRDWPGVPEDGGQVAGSTASERGETAARQRSAAVALGTLLLCCGTLAVFQGVFKTTPPSDIAGVAWPLVVSCALLATGVVIAADFALATWASRRLVSRLFLPVAVVACALVACATEGESLSRSAIFASYFLFLVYTFSELDSVLPVRLAGVQVLAFGLCVVDLGFLLGMALGSAFLPSAKPVLGVVLAATSILAIAVRVRCAREADRFVGRPEGGLFVAVPVGPGRQPDDMVESIGRRSAEVSRVYALSEREGEILAHLACGKTAKTIAADTYITYNTVKTHISHIYQKTGVHTREELVALVVRQGDREEGD